MTYERQDASLVVIGTSAALIVSLVVFAAVTATVYYRATYLSTGADPSVPRATSFTHGPDERIGIVTDYASVMRAADERLHSYGWVDRSKGIARIPIDRAIDLSSAGARPAPAPKERGAVP